MSAAHWHNLPDDELMERYTHAAGLSASKQQRALLPLYREETLRRIDNAPRVLPTEASVASSDLLVSLMVLGRMLEAELRDHPGDYHA